ncbi:hypothetical protein N825_34210 [Skermanella stibiiresistens SB22]|uniref:Uncharacterized protein n=1 Tax=Skermanella stibiiresistens SB22 TaxID=1385369 RepID=W9GTQ5_9PROT|nr:hypothetical protein N825_34210 [Skermanella stibiiresistens SB22]
MGAANIHTIGDLMRQGALLHVTCRSCGHDARFEARDFVAFVGAGRSLDRLPLVCSDCGSKDVTATADRDTLLEQRHRPARPTPV